MKIRAFVGTNKEVDDSNGGAPPAISEAGIQEVTVAAPRASLTSFTLDTAAVLSLFLVPRPRHRAARMAADTYQVPSQHGLKRPSPTLRGQAQVEPVTHPHKPISRPSVEGSRST